MWPQLKSFLFSNTTTRQTIAKNTFWLTVSNVGGRLLRAAIIIYAARVLGADPWGLFSYAITLVTFLPIFPDLGVSRILMRDTAKTPNPHKRSQILATTFIMSLALLAFGVLIIIVLGPRIIHLEGARRLLPIAAFVLIFDT